MLHKIRQLGQRPMQTSRMTYHSLHISGDQCHRRSSLVIGGRMKDAAALLPEQ